MTELQEIRKELISFSEANYQQFSSMLLPNVNTILGVRLPQLRSIAKRVATQEWQSFVESTDTYYFEEVMLQGMVIGYAQMDMDSRLKYVALFVPRIDNWSVCDSFCNGLKAVGKHQQQVWEMIAPYFKSKQEYDVRFGVVMLLNHYINKEYIDGVLNLLDTVVHDGYYAKMAVAWAVATCFGQFPEKTMSYLKRSELDDWTYNKALQKITESLRVNNETKAIIKAMKRSKR